MQIWVNQAPSLCFGRALLYNEIDYVDWHLSKWMNEE